MCLSNYTSISARKAYYFAGSQNERIFCFACNYVIKVHKYTYKSEVGMSEDAPTVESCCAYKRDPQTRVHRKVNHQRRLYSERYPTLQRLVYTRYIAGSVIPSRRFLSETRRTTSNIHQPALLNHHRLVA